MARVKTASGSSQTTKTLVKTLDGWIRNGRPRLNETFEGSNVHADVGCPMEIQWLKRGGALGGPNGSAIVDGPMEIGRLTHHARSNGLGPNGKRVGFDQDKGLGSGLT